MTLELNKQYNFLTPLYELEKRNGHRIVHCVCMCGKTRDVYVSSLLSGAAKSCGCMNTAARKAAGERVRKHNTYNLNDDKVGVGYTNNTGLEFYFDKEDYDFIKDYNWIEKMDHGQRTGYVKMTVWDNNKPHVVYLHRFVLEKNGKNIEGKTVDHINHKPYDNTKDNLRVCEHFENIVACKTYSNNTSGRKGVYWDKARSKWMVVITVNKKTHHIGRFDDFDDAVRAREESEKKYHGEFHFEE